MENTNITVRITSINNPLITKIYNKSNGLRSVDISGTKNTIPYYGIISRAGSVTLIDQDGWLKAQSDNNILPDVLIDIFVDNVLQYSFSSENEISYTIQDKQVQINLIDKIQLFQKNKTSSDLLYVNTDAYSAFSETMSLFGINVKMDKNTSDYMKSIIIPQMVIETNTYWNIISNFVYGVRAIFYRLGDNYYLERMED